MRGMEIVSVKSGVYIWDLFYTSFMIVTTCKDGVFFGLRLMNVGVMQVFNSVLIVHFRH